MLSMRRPHLDHLDDLLLGLAHDEDAAARHRAQEAFLLEQRHRLADRRAGDAERLRQLPLVEADLVGVRVDVGVDDRLLQRGVGLVAEADVGVDRLQRERRRSARRSPAAVGSLAAAPVGVDDRPRAMPAGSSVCRRTGSHRPLLRDWRTAPESGAAGWCRPIRHVLRNHRGRAFAGDWYLIYQKPVGDAIGLCLTCLGVTGGPLVPQPQQISLLRMLHRTYVRASRAAAGNGRATYLAINDDR